jgi:hypothetical protein
VDSVWIVTEGSYSDYRIVAVFSSEEKAERFIDERPLGGDARIETFAVDMWEAVRDNTYWILHFHKDGTTIRQGHDPHPSIPDMDDWRGAEFCKFEKLCWRYVPRHISPYEPCWIVRVIADDAESAVKIAAERVAMAKAQEAGIG